MKYRAEIDGLRALAVTPVILFHAGFEAFNGGFIGVDVFFVISGYLITTIIAEDIENKRFSIVNFYERRARRILPALFFVMLVCMPFAWMWLMPSQMKDFSQSLVAVSLFASNILFWQESGYFVTVGEIKPLLHTWSLAVEEQYYILFPIFLLLTWRFGRDRVFWMIVVIAAISLVLSELGWRHKAIANFYLAPTRAWELFAGSIAAFVVHKHGVRANNALSLLGLAAIVFAIFAYDKTTPFPSVYALVPVIGVVLLILFAAKETLAARLLGLRVFVGIGLISYSAYLWHQPLYAFARIRLHDDAGPMLMLALAAASMALAFFSWKYVEQPFRNRRKYSRKDIFTFSLIGFLFFVFAGYEGHAFNGFGRETATPEPALNRDIWILGDSHAEHLVSGMRAMTAGKVRNMASGGCIPLRDVDRYDSRFEKGACARMMNAHLDEVVRKDPQAIVMLASMGPVYLDGTPFKGKDLARVTGLGVELITNPEVTDRWDVFEQGMRNTLQQLSALDNALVVFVIDIPELGIDFGCGEYGKEMRTPWFTLTDLTDRIYAERRKNCFVERDVYEVRTGRYKRLVHDIAREYPRILVFDPTEYFCDRIKCHGYRSDAGYLYRDIDHLSTNGSIYFASNFAEWLKTRAPDW